MKNFVTIFLVLSLLTASQNIYSQDTNIVKYLPLKVGNVWVYIENYGYPYYMCYNYHKYSVTGTTQIEGKTYLLISVRTLWNSSTCQQGAPNIYSRLYSSMKIRLDSLTGNIYSGDTCSSLVHILIDSLAAKKGDTSSSCTNSQFVVRYVCGDTSDVIILGINRKTKSFGLPHPGGGESQSYAMGIGMYASFWSESTWWWSETLRGCVINGILYGDTNMIVGLHNISSEIPKTFSLYQNYPNPFNPATKIKFSLPNPSEGGAINSKLAIYNVQGREVATLVNEQLNPGTYEVEWDASNFPSGVYFYKLEANNFSETKKLVLIK